MEDCSVNLSASEQISCFFEFLEASKAIYLCSYEQMKKQDALTQDYLHSLELDSLPYSERNKIATRIVANRKERRRHKDKVELYQPLITFLSDGKNQAVLNQLRSICTQMRKTENHQEHRTYVPRVVALDNSNKKEKVVNK